MKDKENSRYDSLKDKKLRTCMVWEQWRTKRKAGMIVWKIGKYEYVWTWEQKYRGLREQKV
jgi:hypothetical protein